MILFDLPLFFTALLFLGLGYLYGYFVFLFIGQSFRWTLCAVVGITFVVLAHFVFVWTIRNVIYGGYLMDGFQVVYDLFWIFSAALPGMLRLEKRLNELK